MLISLEPHAIEPFSHDRYFMDRCVVLHEACVAESCFNASHN